MLRRFRSPPLERLLHRAADDAVAPLAQTELDQFSFQTPSAIAPREMRRTDRGGKLQVLANGQVLVEGIFLRDVTDVALQFVEIL